MNVNLFTSYPLKKLDYIKNIILKSDLERIKIDLIDFGSYKEQNEGYFGF